MTEAERLTEDFHIYSYANGIEVDLMDAVTNYRLTCGPEQPVRYLVISFNRPTLMEARYCDWLNSISEGKTLIYLEAMGGGTFFITNTTTEDGQFIVYAYGIELLLNSMCTYSTAQMSAERLSSSDSTKNTSLIYRISDAIYNDSEASQSYGTPSNDTTYTYPCYPYIAAKHIQAETFREILGSSFEVKPIINVNKNKDSNTKHHLSFYADELLMSSMYLCATADNAFVYYSDNPNYNGITDTKRDACYITDFDTIEVLGYDPCWNTQSGVMNVFPKLDNVNKEYTALDGYMYEHVISQSSQSVEGSNTVINSQSIYCVGNSDSVTSKDKDVSNQFNKIAVNLSDIMPSSVFDEALNVDTSKIAILYKSEYPVDSGNNENVMYWKHEYRDFNWHEDSISKVVWDFVPNDGFAFNQLTIKFGGYAYLDGMYWVRMTADISITIELDSGGTYSQSSRQTVGTDKGQSMTLTLDKAYNGNDIGRVTVTIDNMSFDTSTNGIVTTLFRECDRLYTRVKESCPDKFNTSIVTVNNDRHDNWALQCDFDTIVTTYSVQETRSLATYDGNTYLLTSQLKDLDGTVHEVSEKLDDYLNPVDKSVYMALSVMSVTSENLDSQDMYGDYYGTTIDASRMKVQPESQIPERITDNVVRRYKDPTQATTILMNECVNTEVTTSEGTETKTGWKRAFADTVRVRQLNDDLNGIYLDTIHTCDKSRDDSLLRLSVYTRYYPEMYTAYTFGVANAYPLGSKIASLQSK